MPAITTIQELEDELDRMDGAGTRDRPIDIESSGDAAVAGHYVNTELLEAQIECPRGGQRGAVGPDGQSRVRTLQQIWPALRVVFRVAGYLLLAYFGGNVVFGILADGTWIVPLLGAALRPGAFDVLAAALLWLTRVAVLVALILALRERGNLS